MQIQQDQDRRSLRDFFRFCQLNPHPLYLLEIQQSPVSPPSPALVWSNQPARAWMGEPCPDADDCDLRFVEPFASNPGFLEALLPRLLNGVQPVTAPLQIEHQLRWFDCQLFPGASERADARYILMLQDRTEELRRMRHLERQSYRHDVTGLRNQKSLSETLENLPRKCGDLTLTLFQMDSYDWLELTFGTGVCHKFLQHLVIRFQRHAEGQHFYLDRGLFALVSRDSCQSDHNQVCDAATFQNQSQLISEILSAPFRINNRTLSCRIRVASAKYHSQKHWPPARLLLMARQALKAIPQPGTNASCLSECQEQEFQLNSQLSIELSRIDKRLSLVNCYQPQFDLVTGKLVGYEVFGRHQPRGQNSLGGLSAERFFALARKLRLLAELDREVLLQLTREITGTSESAILRISVNSSPASLLQSEQLDYLIRTSQCLGQGYQLEVELTENELSGDQRGLKSALYKLRDAGIELALDDFGSGYSNLHYLQEMPFNRIKLDRRIIGPVCGNESAYRLLKSTVSLCKGMGLQTVAEGIESEEQLTLARLAGCDVGQGFFWSEAKPWQQLNLAGSDKEEQQYQP